MKKLLLILTVLVGAAFTTSCEGPQGPQGPPGPTVFPSVREIKINFNKSLKRDEFTYTNPVKVYFGDAILVFFLDGTKQNGESLWRQLPLTYNITENGATNSIEYYSIWSLSTTTIFADATTQLSWFRNTHAGSFTQGMVFRIMYIPGEDPKKGNSVSSASTESTKSLQEMSYEEVVAKYNIKESNVIRN